MNLPKSVRCVRCWRAFTILSGQLRIHICPEHAEDEDEAWFASNIPGQDD